MLANRYATSSVAVVAAVALLAGAPLDLGRFRFAFSVFGVYFWMQYRARQRELARPTAEHRLGVRHIGQAFMLSSMADQGDLMRESFKDAAWTAAMEVVIPSPATETGGARTVMAPLTE